jgi:hypothetical protein
MTTNPTMAAPGCTMTLAKHYSRKAVIEAAKQAGRRWRELSHARDQCSGLGLLRSASRSDDRQGPLGDLTIASAPQDR